MSKKLILITITSVISIIVISFFFIKWIPPTSAQIKPKGGLKIDSWSYGLGSVSESDLDKSVFSYTLNLTNNYEKEILINSIQPLINKSINNRILSMETVIFVNKSIKPNETIQINGKIVFDTKGLGKPDIVKLEPFITDIKVSTEETISLSQ